MDADVVCELDRHVFESGRFEPGAIVRFGESAGDADDVAAALGTLGVDQSVLGDDVAHADPPAGAQQSRDLGEHGRCRRQVDHAAGDDHVDGCVGERNGVDASFEGFDVRGAGLEPGS